MQTLRWLHSRLAWRQRRANDGGLEPSLIGCDRALVFRSPHLCVHDRDPRMDTMPLAKNPRTKTRNTSQIDWQFVLPETHRESGPWTRPGNRS